MKSKIEGFEKIIEAVGFETVFHDSEVLSLELSRGSQAPSLTACILTRRSLRPSEKHSTDPLYYRVMLMFHDIEEGTIEGFNHQNVLQEMVEAEVNGRLVFRFAGLFGVECSFTCERAEVLSVQETEMQWGKPFTVGMRGDLPS
jgi:hypothetical protein